MIGEHRIDDYEKFYRGGDTSPHHSKCECFDCTQREPSTYNCTHDGTISEFATLPPYKIGHDMLLCLCDRNYHECRCKTRISYSPGFGRFMQETQRAGQAATLTHRQGHLPTLVEGLNLRLDADTSSGSTEVEEYGTMRPGGLIRCTCRCIPAG